MTQPILYQRLEGAAMFAASLFLYWHFHHNLIWFIILLLIIDAFMIGYLINSKIGAHTYNLGHSLIIPSLLVAAGLATSNSLAIGAALIWLAHIGMDRAFGYGLKFADSFKQTHLGSIGKK